MSGATDWRIAQLLCSKLCHDLISPIGAMHNGLELLREDASILEDALDLLGGSTNQAAARLAFYRVAFGGTGTDKPLGVAEIGALVEGILAGGRTRLEPPPDGSGEVSRPLGKLVLNLALLAAEGLARGGSVGFALADGGVEISAEGARASLAEDVAKALVEDRDPEDIDVAVVVPYLCRGLADQEGLEITVDDGTTDRIVIRAAKI